MRVPGVSQLPAEGGGSIMRRLASIAGLIALAATAGCAHMEGGGSGPVVTAEAMVPSDPGISVYVRNSASGR